MVDHLEFNNKNRSEFNYHPDFNKNVKIVEQKLDEIQKRCPSDFVIKFFDKTKRVVYMGYNTPTHRYGNNISLNQGTSEAMKELNTAYSLLCRNMINNQNKRKDETTPN
jgi:hypothetical protein